jgi:hypothetical protein
MLQADELDQVILSGLIARGAVLVDDKERLAILIAAGDGEEDGVMGGELACTHDSRISLSKVAAFTVPLTAASKAVGALTWPIWKKSRSALKLETLS